MTVEEIGAEFGKLLAQLFAVNKTITAKNVELESQLNELSTKVEELEEKLEKSQLQIIAAQGRRVIQGDNS